MSDERTTSDDDLWDLLDQLGAKRREEVGRLRRDLECALSSHSRQQHNTLAFKAERDELAVALRNLLSYAESRECSHVETHRAGAIWTICSHCGKQWADDEGGFAPYEEPTAIADAYEILSKVSSS
jgi:hypothetical protein